MDKCICDETTVLVRTNPEVVGKVSKHIRDRYALGGAMGEYILARVGIRQVGEVATLDGVEEVHEGNRVSAAALKRASAEGKRLATLWNWKLQTERRTTRVSDRAISSIMGTLRLKIQENYVIDRRTEKRLGKIETRERNVQQRFYSPNPGCWWLWGTNSWRVIPGFFGAWTQAHGTSSAYKCNSTGGRSSTRLVVDYIRVSVWNRVGAYAWRSRSNASFVDAWDWEYVWLWEVRSGGARTSSDHYARDDSSVIHFGI